MKISVKTQDGVSIATLEGEIDGKTAPEVQQTLIPLTQEQSKLVLDMTKVKYMSSAGLRTMLLLYRQASSNDSQLALAGLAEDIKDTMSATGFLDFFTLSNSVADALEVLNND